MSALQGQAIEGRCALALQQPCVKLGFDLDIISSLLPVPQDVEMMIRPLSCVPNSSQLHELREYWHAKSKVTRSSGCQGRSKARGCMMAAEEALSDEVDTDDNDFKSCSLLNAMAAS